MKCTKCNIEKDATDFPVKSSTKSGRESRCRVCFNTYQRAYYKNSKSWRSKRVAASKIRKSEINKQLISLKESTPCKDCGKFFPFYVMDFDHRENKSFLLSSASRLGLSDNKIKMEILKCDLVCSNCHRIRTHTRKSK